MSVNTAVAARRQGRIWLAADRNIRAPREHRPRNEFDRKHCEESNFNCGIQVPFTALLQTRSRQQKTTANFHGGGLSNPFRVAKNQTQLNLRRIRPMPQTAAPRSSAVAPPSGTLVRVPLTITNDVIP